MLCSHGCHGRSQERGEGETQNAKRGPRSIIEERERQRWGVSGVTEKGGGGFKRKGGFNKRKGVYIFFFLKKKNFKMITYHTLIMY